MRILMLNYEFPPVGGGGGNATLHLLEQMSEFDELTVDLLTCGLEKGIRVETPGRNVRVHKVGISKKDLHYWRKSEVIEWLIKAGFYYRRLIRQNDYDLAHGIFAFPSGWLCYRSRKKFPYIVSLRGSDVPGYNSRLGVDYKVLGPLFVSIWKNARRVVANSVGLKRLAHEFLSDVKIDVIPNGVDTDRFSYNAPSEPGSVLRLLGVCRLVKRKRVDLMIDTVNILNRRGIKTVLEIAGTGKLQDDLKEYATRTAAGDSVVFAGRLDRQQMADFYRRGGIYLNCSEHEGMSNAVLEAMASGLAVVTSDCEGVDELMGDNGIVVTEFSPELFADAVASIASDSQRYKQMCIKSRARAEEFSWHGSAKKYVDIYKDICRRDQK